MSDYFEKYPASSDSLRELARNASGSGSGFVDVRSKLDSGHRDALDEVSGDLNGAIGPTIEPHMANASQAAQAAIWAACQLEIFADAVDAYNETSSDPRSIEKLNAAFDDLASNEIRHAAGPLNREKARLEADLDDAASSVSSALENGPTEADLKREWQAGNLSVAAIVAWPGLGLSLTDLPVDLKNSAITEAGLGHLSDEELAHALGDANLNLEVREAILETRPAAVEKFAADWKLAGGDELSADPGLPPSDLPCTPNVNGQIVGPDGRLYELDAPPPRDELSIHAPNDFMPNDGSWKTLGSREGNIAFGDEIDLTATTQFVLISSSGLGKQPGDWHSVGTDQQAYMYMNDGTVSLEPDSYATKDAQDNRPDYGPLPKESWRDPDAGYDKKTSAAYLIASGLEGLNNAQQAEYNRHWATEVIFQENENGERRAVINMYQIQSNGDQLRVGHSYGVVDPETGELMPYSAED